MSNPRNFTLITAILAVVLGILIPSDQFSLVKVLVLAGAFAIVAWRAFPDRYGAGTGPVLVLLLVLGALPALVSIAAAISDVGSANLLDGRWRFVGLSHLLAVARDADNQRILVRTFLLAGACVAVQLAIGVPWGFLLARKRAFDWTDGLLAIPIVTPPIITGLMWRAAFDDSYGVIGRLLRLAHLTPPIWFQLSGASGWNIGAVLPTALLPSIAAETWQWAPFVALVTALGLRQIPPALIEWSNASAKSGYRAALVITAPILGRLLLLVAVLRYLDSLKVFESVWVPFGNGVLTATSSIRVVSYALEQRDYSSAAAFSAIILVIVIVLTSIATPHILAIRRRPDA